MKLLCALLLAPCVMFSDIHTQNRHICYDVPYPVLIKNYSEYCELRLKQMGVDRIYLKDVHSETEMQAFLSGSLHVIQYLQECECYYENDR